MNGNERIVSKWRVYDYEKTCDIEKFTTERIVIDVFNTIRINDGIELAREFYKKSCLYRYDERMRYNMKVSCILELAKKYVEFSEDTKAIM